MSAPARRIAANVLVVLASVVMVPALVAGYGWRAAVDSDQFANRATAALRDDSVRSVIAELVTGTFYLLVVGAGAFAGAIVAWLGGNELVQAVVASAVALVGAFLVHNWHVRNRNAVFGEADRRLPELGPIHGAVALP